uniref:Uncharacterized protein n=1 Tax=Glossina palpalis gambiensis TaxID=67801 RepID=A0A1B0AX20_9MUSC
MGSTYVVRLNKQTAENSILPKSRRTWQKNYAWFPGAQKAIFSEMERVYKEEYKKYGEELFKEYAHSRRLNTRIYSDINAKLMKHALYNKYDALRPYRNEFGRLPLFYYLTACAQTNTDNR